MGSPSLLQGIFPSQGSNPGLRITGGFFHGNHQMVNTEIRLIIFLAVKDGEGLYSQQKQDWELADCGSDHELLIAKFRLI